MDPFPSAVSFIQNDIQRKLWGHPIYELRQVVAKADDDVFQDMRSEASTVKERTVLQGIAVLMNAICEPDMRVSLHEAVANAANKAGMSPNEAWNLLSPKYFGFYNAEIRKERVDKARKNARKLLAACEKEHLMPFYEQATQEVNNIYARERILWERDRREQAKIPRPRPTPAPQPTNQTARHVLPSSAWIIEDAPGQDLKPDPAEAATTEQLVDALAKLHVWAGETSFRELSRRVREQIAHSTFSTMLSERSKLPTYRTLVSFVQALGCDDEEVRRWVSAWRQVRSNRSQCT